MSESERLWLVANEDHAYFFPVWSEAEVSVYRDGGRTVRGPFVSSENRDDGMSEIGRDLAVLAVEEHLIDTFGKPDPALGEEWLTDQADEIVSLVTERLGAVGEDRTETKG